ncbi:peptidoglycan-binding protein [Betaproteobacteria bacterium]|nr:peptidoglycan-binding protein [Betaproteobacteria bacterium]GHU40810.1 peptidoglycan-binding protein [Betaproteobacteria bacterium]
MLVSMWAEAAGLGDVTVHSQLGQPLRAEVRVSATSDELAGMVAHLASQEVYSQTGARYSSTARLLRFSLEKVSGGAIIKVTSEKPINDPFIGFLLELSWPAGRVTREYTFLVDPPKDAPGKSAVAAAQPDAIPVATPAAAATTPSAVLQATKAAAGEHTVKSGETLYRIATENLLAGATLEQMQVALYRANPGAFDGSITRLRTGSVLKIPALADVTAISSDEAKKALNAPRSSSASSSTQAPRASASSSGQGKSAATPAPNRQAVKPATGPTAAELETRKKAIKEFNERVDNMTQEVDKLQQQVESKNEQLARIEKEKAERKAALDAAAKQPEVEIPEVTAPPEVPATPVVTEAPPVVPEATPSEEDSQIGESEEETSADNAEEATEPPPVPEQPEQPAQPSQPARAPVQLDTQEPEEGGLPLGWILGGVGALVVLVGGFLFLRRRGGSDSDGDTLTGSSIAPRNDEPFSEGFSTKGPASVFQTAGGQSVDTSNTIAPPSSEFSQAGPGAIDTDEVDPVAEADVYMAYGRDGQAEEILLNAVHKDPKRIAIPLKLLEVYASRKSVKDFETLATELYSQTGGKGAEWEKVLALGSALDPANPLYGGTGAPDAESFFESEAAISSLLEGGDEAGLDLLASDADAQSAAPSEFDLLTSDGIAKSATPEFDLLASDAVAKPVVQPVQPQQPQVPPPNLTESGAFSFALDSNPVPPPVATAAAPADDPLLSMLQEESATNAAADDPLLSMLQEESATGAAADDPLLSMLQEESATGAEEDDPLLSLLHEESITGARSDQQLLGGETEASSSAPASSHKPVPEPGSISQAILDFDLGGDSLAPSSSDTQPYDESESDIAATIVNPDIAALDSLTSETGSQSLVDFELDVPDAIRPRSSASEDELTSDDMAATTSILSIEPDEDMEFDVQLTESTILGNPGGAGFDLSGISLDLAKDTPAPASAPAPELEALAAELDEEATTSNIGVTVSDPQRDEVNTKLDLAKAYEEMGDLEGARELLGEVVSEGAPDQIAEAQSILTRLNV